VVRTVSLVAAVAIVLTGACGSSSKPSTQSATTTTTASSGGTAPSTATTAPALTVEKLKSALLTVTELPTGWSVTPSNSSTQGACNKESVDKTFPPAAKTEVSFVKGGNVPLLVQQLYSYSTAAIAREALAKYDANARACTTYKQEGTTIEIGALSLPPLGDRNAAYRLTISQNGVSVIGDSQVIQKGPVLLYVAYANLFADTEQMVTFTRQAYTKAVRTLGLA
jgi:hypothetical protein